ncbi:MAG TPA: class I SAM-dependent methyltransferase [Gemmatimonadales bacterium]|nr:class I SAM-dependent methyltransferase [Gemmatimonadales bacterium]
MELADVLRDPPKPHIQSGRRVSMGLVPAAVAFIHEIVDDSCATLETGCGLSTVAFALTGARHIVIAPLPDELEYLKRYCDERHIATDRVRFIAGGSQSVLPSLQPPPLDLVLIDGCHGFPSPCIDWFFTAGFLKRGGHLVVDDTWVWSCQILRDFLCAQPQWQLITEFEYRTAVFRKLENGAEWLEWTEQPLVARAGRRKWIGGRMHYRQPFGATRVGRAANDLRHGDVKGLMGKIARVVSRLARATR